MRARPGVATGHAEARTHAPQRARSDTCSCVMRASAILISSLVLALACDRADPSAPAAIAAEPDEAELTPASGIALPRRAPPIRVESLALDGDREAFVVRGARGSHSLVFLHGMCSHGQASLQSFQRASAEYGVAVAPTGDMACPGKERHSWSHRLDAIDGRIVEALFAAGASGEPRGLTLIGYSLGASRAEQLARKYPERYDTLVLIGGPTQPSPHRMAHLRAAAMIAGERDRQDLMKRGARAFDAAGIRARFFVLPGAKHGEMGSESERVMREVLDWVRR
jgi:predicted esterase